VTNIELASGVLADMASVLVDEKEARPMIGSSMNVSCARLTDTEMKSLNRTLLQATVELITTNKPCFTNWKHP